MNYRELVLCQINHKRTEVMPYDLVFQQESRDRLDKYYGHTEWRKRIKPYIERIWTMDCLCKTPLDAAYSRDIYGNIWRDDGYTAHLEKPVLPDPCFNGFVFPKAHRFFSEKTILAARNKLKSSTNGFTIIHIPWGIFEKSWTLRGFENALADMVINKVFYHELVEKITGHLLEFIDMALSFPVDGIMFGDDWGGQNGLFMGKDRWNEFFRRAYSKLFGKVKESGKYVLTHCCGNIVDILPDLIDIGLDVYESFQPEAMDIYKVKREFGKDLTFWGGLGAQSVIPFGTPEDIHTEVNRLKNEIGKGGGFILAPSKDPSPETPTSNLVALIEAFNKE